LAVGAVAIALGLGGAFFALNPQADAKAGLEAGPFDPLRDIDPEIPGMKASVARDFITALWEPQFARAGDATLSNDEPVIGLAINGQAKAYPLAILNSHEIANDVVGGIPVAVTW
jgi:hypothetical protein